jgi:hypothetical protein
MRRQLNGAAKKEGMPDDKVQNEKDEDYLSDLKGRFGDILTQRETEQPESGQRKNVRALIKDRLAIVAVILVLAFLAFLMIDGSFVNFRCTFAEFVTFECNRWAGEEHPSLRQ